MELNHDFYATLSHNLSMSAVYLTPDSEPTIELASGKLSNYYVNIRAAMGDPACVKLVGPAMMYLLTEGWRNMKVDYLASVITGGLPVATAMLNYAPEGSRLRNFWVLKTPKKRGPLNGKTGMIEGLLPSRSLAGKNVVMIEDTTTTGGSIFKAIDVCLEEGANVVGTIVVADRTEGIAEVFRKKYSSGVPALGLVKATALLPQGFVPRVIDPAAA